MNYADQWAEILSSAPTPQEEPTAEIELCGFKFLGRRIPLQTWIRSGRLPQGLLMQLLDVAEKRTDEVSASTIPVEDIPAALQFQRDAVIESVVAPRIVPGKAKKGEISYMTLCEQRPDFIDAVVNWVVAGCPGVPVKTTKGDTSVETLSRFRQKQPGRISAESGTDSADVQREAEPLAATG